MVIVWARMRLSGKIELKKMVVYKIYLGSIIATDPLKRTFSIGFPF